MLLTCALREVVVSLFTFFAESSTEIFQAGTLNLTTAVSYTKGHAILHQPEINHKAVKLLAVYFDQQTDAVVKIYRQSSVKTFHYNKYNVKTS